MINERTKKPSCRITKELHEHKYSFLTRGGSLYDMVNHEPIHYNVFPKEEYDTSIHYSTHNTEDIVEQMRLAEDIKDELYYNTTIPLQLIKMIDLHFYRGHNLSEVATILNTSPQNVYNQLKIVNRKKVELDNLRNIAREYGFSKEY